MTMATITKFYTNPITHKTPREQLSWFGSCAYSNTDEQGKNTRDQSKCAITLELAIGGEQRDDRARLCQLNLTIAETKRVVELLAAQIAIAEKRIQEQAERAKEQAK